MSEMERIEDRAQEIARLLPAVLRRGRAPDRADPLSILLSAMAALQLRPEGVLDELEAFYDPQRAPLDSLVFLAYWMDLEALIAPGQPSGLAWRGREDWRAVVAEGVPPGIIDRLRDLIGEAVPLLRQRGTAQGLVRFLQAATGAQGFVVFESRERPFHIHVAYPVEVARYAGLVRRIVELVKPAYLTCDLVLHYPVIEIEGIGPVYAGRLHKQGIHNTWALLERGMTRAGRQSIANEADIRPALIREWVSHADLLRVQGIGPEYADLLQEAGVGTVPELAQRSPQQLYRRLAELNQKKRRVRRLPSRSAVRNWIAQAGRLPRVIRY
jgi:predicted flap endonuclease-1-like 5' DNA nuclease